MPISLHSHSGQFCKHATDTLESVIQTAIDQGFISYGLSEHMPRNRLVDLYPEESHMKPSELQDQFNQFIIEASRLKEVHSSKINLLIGMETELIDESVTFNLIDQLLDRYSDSLDYLVGSVHHVNQIPIDLDLETFEKAVLSFESSDQDTLLQSSDLNSLKPIYQLCATYFDAQYELINRYHPEVIGHFDLCLLFHPNLDLQSEPLVWNKIERNVKLVISYGALFEVNSAAIRKGWSTPYPSQPILKLIISSRGRLTLSDDSHGSSRVGLNYDKTLEYLKCNHVQSLWYLVHTQGNEVFQPRNKVSAVRIPGNWLEHPFWSKISSTGTTTTYPSTTFNQYLPDLSSNTPCTSLIQLGRLKSSDQSDFSTGNIHQDEQSQNERLKWKNFPIEKFTNQTWFIISSSLPFWKNKKNPTITYSSFNDQPINVLADLVEYHTNLTDEPGTRRKRIEGIDRPINIGDNKKEMIEDQIVEWRWQGKGILKLLKSDWQLLGYHFSSSTPSIGNNNQLESPDWVITFFHKTLFTPAGIDIYSKSPSALSHQLKLQLIQALQKHPSKVVSNLANLMLDIHHDQTIN